MSAILHKLFTGYVVSRETPTRTTLRDVLDHAWVDNCPDGLCYARGWARKRFNEVVGAYVTEYYARTGRLPVGNHHVVGESQRMIWFAPLTRELETGLTTTAGT